MRAFALILLLAPALPLVQAQPADAYESAVRGAAPFIAATAPPRVSLLRDVATTALGCELMAGLPLAQALDAWRFDFPTEAGDFTVYTSTDGKLTQLCDVRVPNLGAGFISLASPNKSVENPQEAASCWLRAKSDALNVREAPWGKVLSRIDRLRQHEALGRNDAGDWLFYRAGWVKRSELRLAGNCDDLPALDPARVASGVIHYCPPGYAGYLPPRISLGRRTARSASPTFANRLRASPQPDAALLAEIPPRHILDEVLDGPACQGNYVWWQVTVAGQIGWTIESDSLANFYYLEPYQRSTLQPYNPAQQPRPPTLRRIDAPDAPIDTIARLELAGARGVAFSPDGSLLAVAGAAGARFYRRPDFTPASLDAVIANSSDQPGNWLKQPLDTLDWSHGGDKLAVGRGRELQVWERATGRLTLHYRFPYALRSVAFSRDDRWLAVTGASASGRHSALWVYDQHGELTRSLPLVGAGAPPTVSAAPKAIPGDFIYSSADKLFLLSADASPPRAIYQLAGLPQRAFDMSDSLLALALGSPGAGWLALVDGEDANAPGRTLRLDTGDLAFSPDGRFLAATLPDRVVVLGAI